MVVNYFFSNSYDDSYDDDNYILNARLLVLLFITFDNWPKEDYKTILKINQAVQLYRASLCICLDYVHICTFV